MGNKVISNFWTAVIGCVILTISALLLDGNAHAGKVLILEGALLGIRVGDQAMKTYLKGKEHPDQLRV